MYLKTPDPPQAGAEGHSQDQTEAHEFCTTNKCFSHQQAREGSDMGACSTGWEFALLGSLPISSSYRLTPPKSHQSACFKVCVRGAWTVHLKAEFESV